MKKMQLKKLAIPLLFSSMALVAQANDHSHKSHGHSHKSHHHHKSHGHHSKIFDFYDFNQMEYYAGAGLGRSTLKDATLNRNTDSEIIQSTNQLKGLVQIPEDLILEGVYEQKPLDGAKVIAISNSDIENPATLKPQPKSVLNDAVKQGKLVKSSQYTLPAEAYKQQFDATFKPEFLSFNATGFYLDAKGVSHFSAMLGAKALNKHQFLIGIEAQATYFKEKYESLVDTYKLQGSIYTYPKAENIYLTNITKGSSAIAFDKNTAKVKFDAEKLKINKTLTGKAQVYATLEFKRKLAFTGDVSFGKRFELKNGMSLDAFAILGYGYTTFEVKNDDKKETSDDNTKGQPLKVVTYSFNEAAKKELSYKTMTYEEMIQVLQDTGDLNIKEVTQLKLKNKSATGLRFGAGLTLNFQNQYAVSLKIVQAKLKGYSLLDDQLKSLDMSASFQYKF